MPNTQSRPDIPDPMQRAVRQRCAFGCVLCGLPIYQYHHMQDYAEVLEHTESNLTLLCSRHHTEATNGLLTRDQVAEADRAPANKLLGISHPFALHFSGQDFVAEIGSNQFSSSAPMQPGGFATIPISIDDTDILFVRIDNVGRLFLNLNIFDECNLHLLVVNENSLVFRRDVWDITFEGKVLTIRQASRNIFLEIEFCPPQRIRILRGRILCNTIRWVEISAR